MIMTLAIIVVIMYMAMINNNNVAEIIIFTPRVAFTLFFFGFCDAANESESKLLRKSRVNRHRCSSKYAVY